MQRGMVRYRMLYTLPNIALIAYSQEKFRTTMYLQATNFILQKFYSVSEIEK